MTTPAAFTAADLASRIETYFNNVENENQPENKSAKSDSITTKKTITAESAPVTFSGLAYALGFDSRDAFTNYEQTGEFALLLKRARLRIEAVYERKLHQQSPTGAIFALKSWGWNDKDDNKTDGPVYNTLKVEVVETGVLLSENEKDVNL